MKTPTTIATNIKPLNKVQKPPHIVIYFDFECVVVVNADTGALLADATKPKKVQPDLMSKKLLCG